LNPKLQPLVELQQLDQKIAEIRQQQQKLPSLLEAAESPHREATRLLKELDTTVEQRVKERRERERELEIHEGHVEKLRARLSELKTNKEYQAHLFEIEIANKRKREIEDQILSLMEQIEAGQKGVKQMQVRATEAESALNQEKARLDALTEELSADLTRLDNKRGQLTSAVEADLLVRYSKLKQSRKDLALAPIRNGICFGCRLQLPPQLVTRLHVLPTDSVLGRRTGGSVDCRTRRYPGRDRFFRRSSFRISPPAPLSLS
jgi:predicted  nucleic acid-binding Zn-ribbon protein